MLYRLEKQQQSTEVNSPEKKNDVIDGSAGPQLYKVLIFDDYLFERVSTKAYPDHDHYNRQETVVMSENQDEDMVEIAENEDR